MWTKRQILHILIALILTTFAKADLTPC
ncbi:hypothetical protein V1477_006834, partial [Vespula maculifrons]